MTAEAVCRLLAVGGDVGSEPRLLASLEVIGASEAQVGDQRLKQLAGVGLDLVDHWLEMRSSCNLVADPHRHDNLVVAIYRLRQF